MARGKTTYRPPPLDRRILVRNPRDKPVSTSVDAFGVPIGGPTWGTEVWAGRRDRAPTAQGEDDIEVRRVTTIWTIREREGIDPNFEVVYRDQVYESIGPPVVRGGAAFGRRTEYFELHTVRRS